MDKLLILFLYYIEEGMAAAFLGPAMLRIGLGIKTVAVIGVIFGFAVLLVRDILKLQRYYPFAHTAVLLPILAILIKLFAGAGWGYSLAAAGVSFAAIAASEVIILPIVYRRFGLDGEKAQASPWLHIGIGYVGGALFFALTALVYLSK
jgi:hypothetical protein